MSKDYLIVSLYVVGNFVYAALFGWSFWVVVSPLVILALVALVGVIRVVIMFRSLAWFFGRWRY